MSLIIGLTGGIGSGKTSATRFFAAEGIAIIDADTIAHELTGVQGDAIPNIKKYFGVDFITKNGKLDRKKMKNRIFSDINSRKKLEELFPKPFGIAFEGLEEMFRAVFVKTEWNGVILRFDLGFRKEKKDFGYWIIKNGKRY